jgi:hypothetical protein
MKNNMLINKLTNDKQIDTIKKLKDEKEKKEI